MAATARLSRARAASRDVCAAPMREWACGRSASTCPLSVRLVGARPMTSSMAAWAMPTTIGALPVEAIVKAGMR